MEKRNRYGAFGDICDIIECANASFPSNERAIVEFL